MNNKSSLFLTIAACACLISGCQSNTHEVRFEQIEDGVARFQVENNSDDDITSMVFELTYLNDNDEVIKIDTVNYRMSEENPSEIWLEANNETFFVQSIPEGTTVVTSKIISINDK